MKKVIIDGQLLNVYRTTREPHGFIGLYVGETCAARRVQVPTSWWNSDMRGAVITGGTRVQKVAQ